MEIKKHSILVVDDDHHQSGMLASFLRDAGFDAFEADNADSTMKIIAEKDIDAVISDMRMPGIGGLELHKQVRDAGHTQPFLFVTAYPDVKDAVSAMKDGAVDYIEKPVDLDEVLDLLRNSLNIGNHDTEKPKRDFQPPPGVVAESPKTIDVFRDAALIAPSDVNVLIHGESGAGKEVLADALHRWSKRANKPFLKINCAAIAPTLLESELFGYEKGAFTGASKKRMGLFEMADKGTILLDEIGEMPLPLQAKLLHITEKGRFIPVGGNSECVVDIRIIAATNKKLEEEVEKGTFREDLYYRLETFELRLPPLRERREDILPLANTFLEADAASNHPPKISDSAASLLLAYNWPGNARELRNAMKRAFLMSASSGLILPEHLPKRILDTGGNTVKEDNSEGVIDQMERMIILQTLKKNNYNRSRTAEELKMSRRTLTFKIRRLKDAGFDI